MSSRRKSKPKRKSPKRKSPKRKSKRKTEDIFVYPVQNINGFEKEWKQKCKKQKISVKYAGASGMDEATHAHVFTIPTRTYGIVKKCWEDTLTKHGIRKTWPIAKSYEQLEKKKKRLRIKRQDDLERMRLKRKSRKSPKKRPKPTKRYAKGDRKKCGEMPKRLKRIKTPKECVKKLTGRKKGKHVWVTRGAASLGGYDPYH